MVTEDILQYDKKHIWHPYTSMLNPLPVYPVKSARGVYIELEDGRKLIDGMSSWWSAIHGYNHPVLNNSVKRQLESMSHVMFGGFTHRPAVELAKQLMDITHDSLEKVFFCDSGSVAIEVAMKMALQYWYSRGKQNKNRFLTIRSGYHGDTWHSMSVSDTETGMHKIFHDCLPEQLFIPPPKSGFSEDLDISDRRNLEQAIEKNHSTIASVILEPIVQGTGGMRFYSPQFLNLAKQLCLEYDILLIFDEIATGFGRTGKLFAYEHASLAPDILCLGKAMTGGYMSLAATLCTNEIAMVISSSHPGIFMHGPTFMANPLACSVAKANIKLLLGWDWAARISEMENQMRAELEPARKLKQVKDIRVLGGIGVIETINPVDVAETQRVFVDNSVWIRPFNNLLYIMPPYIISPGELSRLTSTMIKVLHR